jgi:hypothetical protein
MVVLESVAALLTGAARLFRYNRTNFRFDSLQQQEAHYHLAKMRVEQFNLYREDISDLFDLTQSRTDSYLFVSTVTALVSLALFYEGRVPPNTPAWLFFLWASSVTSAFMYLLLSQWFAIQASIHAQTFKTVLRTQWLRLPLPSFEETQALAPKLEAFEREGAIKMLRIPMSGSLLSPGELNEDEQIRIEEKAENLDVQFAEHFVMYQELQRCWKCYDAFGRVALVLGTNQFLLVACYTGIAYFGFERSEWAYWGLIAMFVAFGIGHAHMNLLISGKRMIWFGIMYAFSPVMAGVINAFFRVSGPSTVALPVMYALTVLMQMLALGFLVILTMETNPDSLMPHKFATVQLIDVLGLDLASRPRQIRETAVADAVPRADVVRRSLDRKGAFAFEEEETNLSIEEEHWEPSEAESLPVRIFQGMSLVILAILLWGLIQSTLVAFGLTTLGWDNNPSGKVNRKD